ncbi:MAG: protein kinase [Acidobacteria bacterium]|nr:protein kinase [Acidobacteriota bacterium]
MNLNPYLDRVSIRDVSRFYGRQREAARIFSRIGAARPQSVSVVGERRIGKSSLLNHISFPEIRRKMLPDPENYVFIKMDLQERRNISLEEFFRELILLMLSSADFSSTLTSDFEGVRKAVVSHQKHGRKIVILFDEFDVVTSNPRFGEEFFSFFRSLANNYDLAFITSSGRDLQELCHTSKVADSPFFNIFSTLNLGVFSPEEAQQLINIPSMKAGLPLESYTDRIIEFAGYFPFYLQIACSAFFENLVLDGVDVDEEQVAESFREEVTPHFNYVWENLSADEKEVLHLVRRGEEIPPRLAYLARNLKKAGYIRQSGDEAVLFSTIFAEFLDEKIHQEQERAARPVPAPGKTSPEAATVQDVSRTITGGPSAMELEDFFRDAASGGPERLGSFKVLRKLGEGGMGTVYKALDTQLKRHVAIKLISPRNINDTVVRQRFLKEARSASALNHPNICTIFQVGQESGLDFIVMEYVEGQTLKELIREGAFEPDALCRIGIQIAEALEHAHSRRMIHRDIKPANIMISTEGRVKILDFGLVKILEGEEMKRTVATGLTEQGAILGTVNYMSPEQLAGGTVDHRTDLFSLGIVLYELASGAYPFEGENYIGIMHAILYKSPRALPTVVPPELQRIIGHVLEKDSERRYPSATELRLDLQRFLRTRTLRD